MNRSVPSAGYDDFAAFSLGAEGDFHSFPGMRGQGEFRREPEGFAFFLEKGGKFFPLSPARGGVYDELDLQESLKGEIGEAKRLSPLPISNSQGISGGNRREDGVRALMPPGRQDPRFKGYEFFFFFLERKKSRGRRIR